jgi:hypothetical protein
VRLVVLGDVVLGVLLEVALLPRCEDALCNRPAPFGLELFELGFERLQAGGRDRFATGLRCSSDC